MYTSIWRVNLKVWHYTFSDRAPADEITSVSSSGNHKAKTTFEPSSVGVLTADTKLTGRCFQVIARSGVDKISPGPKLDALTAERVFGWKNVHKHEGSLVGKRQDQAGHWRRAKVPSYSTNPLHGYATEGRIKQLARLDRYQKELAKITHSKNIPSEWATPDHRCRAAIKAMGQYGQVLPLNKKQAER